MSDAAFGATDSFRGSEELLSERITRSGDVSPLEAVLARLEVRIDQQTRVMVDLQAHVKEQGALISRLTRQLDSLVSEPSENVDALKMQIEALRAALISEQAAHDRLEVIRRDYAQLVQRVVRAVRDTVPANSTILVVSKGDEDLVKLNSGRAWHFPRSEKGTYSGHHPANSVAAIAQLEALRRAGAQYFVLPATARWWLDHYREFRRHLESRYRILLDEEETCLIVRIDRRSTPAPLQQIQDAIAEFEDRFDRVPTILDFDSCLRLAEELPQDSVFTPVSTDGVLPYLPGTIDVVVTRRTPRFLKEARRVAGGLVAVVPSEIKPGDGSEPAGRRRDMRLKFEWRGTVERSNQAVSIIVPCHNGADFTEACLSSLDATLPSWFRGEIIAIDDASTDGTATMLRRRVSRDLRLRWIHNSRNLGFLRSCNRAAKVATGQILVFLNNDTMPWDGWLSPLLRIFRKFPDAGAAGGKLVLSDGSLQEAGSLVFRDGSAANFGRGDHDLDDPLYNYVRAVDYCSSALLATRRDLFNRLGGFDTRYSPACYEDTDYCFRVREAGYRVYYQPACVVTHQEGASCGTDTSRGVKGYQVLNQRKFWVRWKDVLSRYPERPVPDDKAAWRKLAVCAGVCGAVDE